MNKLFETGGDFITQDAINKFIFRLADIDEEIIKIYVKILKKNQNIPDGMYQIIAWICGEYGSKLSDKSKVLKIMNLLIQKAWNAFEFERTRAYILLALTRLHCSLDFVKHRELRSIMLDYRKSKHLEVQ